MYIEQGYKGFHESWRYLIGTVIIFFGWQFLGMLPLLGMLMLEVIKGAEMPTDISGMAKLLGNNLFLFLMLLSFVFGLAATFFTCKFLHGRSILSLTSARKKMDWKRFFLSFVIWSVLTILFIGVDLLLSPEDYVYNFNWKPFVFLFVISVLLVPLQTSFEEYFIRGYLMQGIGILTKNRWFPLLFTSLLFGLLHIFNPEVEKLGYGIMVFYVGTGLFLGILTLMDEGLELSLGFHAANNLVTALLVTSDWTAFQTDSIFKDISKPELGWDVFVPVLVIYPILLWVFSKKYGWRNWKDRLTGKVMPKELIAQTTDNGSGLH